MTLVSQSLPGSDTLMEPCDSCTDFVRHRIQYQSHGCVQLEEKRLHKLTVLVHLYGISDSFEFHFLLQSYPTRTFSMHCYKKHLRFSITKKSCFFISSSRNTTAISNRHRPQADKKGGAMVDCIVEAEGEGEMLSGKWGC